MLNLELIIGLNKTNKHMEKYYISRAEYQLSKIKDALEFLEDAMKSLKDGKQFDCMEKMNMVHDIITNRLIRESNGIIGNLKLDAEKHEEFKKHMRLSMYDYIPQWVSVSDYTDLQLLESYLSYKINGATIEDVEDDEDIYDNVAITPLNELVQEFIKYKLTNK
jgi:hypothetical protein